MQRVHTCTGFIYVDAFSYFLAQGAQADSVPHDNPGVNLVQGCAVHDWYGSKGRSTTMNFQACLLERERERDQGFGGIKPNQSVAQEANTCWMAGPHMSC